MAPLAGTFQAQLHWNVRAMLETYQLGEPYPRSMHKPYPFWASDNPLWHFHEQKCTHIRNYMHDAF